MLVTRLLGLREYRLLAVEGPVSIPPHLIKQSPVMAAVKLPSWLCRLIPRHLIICVQSFMEKQG